TAAPALQGNTIVIGTAKATLADVFESGLLHLTITPKWPSTSRLIRPPVRGSDTGGLDFTISGHQQQRVTPTGRGTITPSAQISFAPPTIDWILEYTSSGPTGEAFSVSGALDAVVGVDATITGQIEIAPSEVCLGTVPSLPFEYDAGI